MMPRAARNMGVLGLLVVAVALFATPACAQLKLGDYTISGDMQGGVRQLYGERHSSRFNEFRDIPQGLFFEDLRLDIDKPGYYYELRAQDLLENDQHLRLSLGSPGLYRLDIEWHEIQHIFHNQAITPYSGVGGNVLTIDSATRSLIQNSGASNWVANVDSLFQGGHKEVVGFDRDRGEVKFKYHLGPDWTVRMAYKNERWDGTRYVSMVFGSSPGGRPVIEIPMPVDYRHDDVRMALEWSRGGNSFEVAYQGSFFRNRYSSVTVDNPFRVTDAAGTVGSGSSAVNGSTRARYSLDPDNQAHYVTLSGALNLPSATRLVGTFSYGWLFQDEDFLPHTINSAITSSSLALPRGGLDGELNPTLINVVLTNQAIQNLSLKARYNYYDLDNNTRRIVLPGNVIGDTRLDATQHIPNRYAYTRQTAGVDASYRFNRTFKLNGGYEYKRNDYEHYEAKKNEEDRWKIGADIKANNWLTLRPAYIYSDREVSGYEIFTAPSQADRRHFNLASRKRNEGKLMAMIFPTRKVSITLEGGVGTDDYTAKYGMQDGSVWNAAVEVSVAPTDKVNLFAGYAHEEIEGKIRSVQSTVSGTVFSDVDAWTMKFTDSYDVVRGGVEFLLLENKQKNQKLTWRSEASYSYSKGETKNSQDNPASTAVNTANWPDIKAKLLNVSSRLDYRLSKNFTIGVGYIYERYTLDDFTQKWVAPVVNSGVTTRFYTLGDRLENFEAHTVAMFVRWQF